MSINFRESPTNMPGKKFRNFYFRNRVTISDHTPTISHMEMETLSVYFNVKTTVRRYHAYQSVSVAVSEKLPCQREGANSEDLFAVVVMTGELIVGREKFLQFAQWFYDKFFVDLLDLQLKHTVLGFLSSVSKKLLEEEIFAGTNFHKLAFDCENHENFPLYLRS